MAADPAEAGLLLAEFTREAWRRGVCWRLGCTTCGCGEIRAGIHHLARGVPLQLIEPHRPEGTPGLGDHEPVPPLMWQKVIPVGWPSDDSFSRRELDRLTTVCIRADLRDVARAAGWPDWLGYLGLILFELQKHDDRRREIGWAWAQQFVAMGARRETWAPFEGSPMTWRDLEAAEQELFLRWFAEGRAPQRR